MYKNAHFDNLCVLEATGRSDVGVAEWRDFRHHLRRSLTHWPLGEALADEVS